MGKRENLYNKDHQGVKDSYREGWERTFGKKGRKNNAIRPKHSGDTGKNMADSEEWGEGETFEEAVRDALLESVKEYL